MSPEMVIHKWACHTFLLLLDTNLTTLLFDCGIRPSLGTFAWRTSYRIHLVPLQALCGDAPRMMWGMDCQRGHQKSGRYTIDPHMTVNSHLSAVWEWALLLLKVYRVKH